MCDIIGPIYSGYIPFSSTRELRSAVLVQWFLFIRENNLNKSKSHIFSATVRKKYPSAAESNSDRWVSKQKPLAIKLAGPGFTFLYKTTTKRNVTWSDIACAAEESVIVPPTPPDELQAAAAAAAAAAIPDILAALKLPRWPPKIIIFY